MIYVSRRLIITCLLLITACVVAGIWGLRSGTVRADGRCAAQYDDGGH